MRTAAKKDANHNDITSFARAVGAVVQDTHQLKNAFDAIFAYRGETYIVEIKNPEYIPKKKTRETMLTDGELDCARMFAAVNVPYYIISTTDELLETFEGSIEYAFSE